MTMVTNKQYNCLKLKDEIHRQMMEEEAGLTDAQIEERRRKDFESSDHPAARLWRELMAEREASLRKKASGVRS